jgi:hypothetical protein
MQEVQIKIQTSKQWWDKGKTIIAWHHLYWIKLKSLFHQISSPCHLQWLIKALHKLKHSFHPHKSKVLMLKDSLNHPLYMTISTWALIQTINNKKSKVNNLELFIGLQLFQQTHKTMPVLVWILDLLNFKGLIAHQIQVVLSKSRLILTQKSLCHLSCQRTHIILKLKEI